MADWTAQELRLRALKELGIVGAGQAASAEDDADAADSYASLYPRLRHAGLVPFEMEAVPDWAKIPLAQILASEMAELFGFTGARLVTIESKAAEAKRQLQRNATVERPASEPYGSTYC